MIQIEYRKEGKLVGLLLEPKNGHYINKSQMQQLKSYFEYAIASKNLNFSNIEIIDTTESNSRESISAFKISNLDVNNNYGNCSLSQFVLDACNNTITEKVIVPQSMPLSDIRHRVFYFEDMSSKTNQNEVTIAVKFTELGSFNNFDVAISNLNDLYGYKIKSNILDKSTKENNNTKLKM